MKGTLLPTGPMSGSGGSRLELGALGAACCAALVILAVFAHFLLCTLVQITSVLTWLFLGWMLVPVPAVGGRSAGVGRSRQAGGSWCDHTRAQGAPPAHGEQWGWSIPPAVVLENNFALFFQGRTHHSASARVVSHSNSFYFREAVTFMNFCG